MINARVDALISKWGLAVFATFQDDGGGGPYPLAPITKVNADPTIYRNGQAVALDPVVGSFAYGDGCFVAYRCLCGPVPRIAVADGGAGYSGDVAVAWNNDGGGHGLVPSKPTKNNGAIRAGITGCTVIDGGQWAAVPTLAIAPPASYYQANGGAPAHYQAHAGIIAAPPIPGPIPTIPFTLTANQFITSPNGQYQLIQQADGNLVIYGPNKSVIWNAQTFGNPGAQTTMQADGNLVVYASGGYALWHTHTFGNPGAYPQLHDDGNLIIYGPDGSALWACLATNSPFVLTSIVPAAAGILGCGHGYPEGSYATACLGPIPTLQLAFTLDASGAITKITQSGPIKGYPSTVGINLWDPSGGGQGAVTIWSTDFGGYPLFALPGAGYGPNLAATMVPTFAFHAVIAHTSAYLTGPSDISGLIVGMAVAGKGIPAGARITAITPSAITLSANATDDGTQQLYAYPTATLVARVDDYIAFIPVDDPGADFIKPPTFTLTMTGATPSRTAILVPVMGGPAEGDVFSYDAPAAWLTCLTATPHGNGTPLPDLPATKGATIVNSVGSLEPATGGIVAFAQKPTMLAGANMGEQPSSAFAGHFTACNRLKTRDAWVSSAGDLTKNPDGSPVSWPAGASLRTWAYGPGLDNQIDDMGGAGFVGRWTLAYTETADGGPSGPNAMSIALGGGSTITTPANVTIGGTAAPNDVIRTYDLTFAPNTGTWQPNVFLAATAPTGADGRSHWTAKDVWIIPPDAISGAANPPDRSDPCAPDPSFVRAMTTADGHALGFLRNMDVTQGYMGKSDLTWPWELLNPNAEAWGGKTYFRAWASVARHYNTDPASKTYAWSSPKIYGGQPWLPESDPSFPITGTLTAGSSTVTSLSNNALMVGSTVIGDGVPATDAYGNPVMIARIAPDGSSFDLSIPALASGALALSITNPPSLTITPGNDGRFFGYDWSAFSNGVVELKFPTPHGFSGRSSANVWTPESTNGHPAVGVTFTGTSGPYVPTSPNGGPFFVTGPFTIVIPISLYYTGLINTDGGDKKGDYQTVNATTEIDLTAGGTVPGWQVDFYVPRFESSVPYQYPPAACAKIGCGCWVNIPATASDALVRALAIETAAHAGDKIPIALELSNEIWNGMGLSDQPYFQVVFSIWCLPSYPLGSKIATYYTADNNPNHDRPYDPYGSAAPLAAHLYDTFVAAWKNAGKDPARVHTFLGSFWCMAGRTATTCALAKAGGFNFDALAVGPYLNTTDDSSLVKACAPLGSMPGALAWPVELINDFFRFHMAYGGSGNNPGWTNQSFWHDHHTACQNSGLNPPPVIVGYEGAANKVVPDAVPFQNTLIHDCVAHPSWADTTWGFLAACQQGDQTTPDSGAILQCIYQLYCYNCSPDVWRMAGGPAQPAGDGISFAEDSTGRYPRKPNQFATIQGGFPADNRSHDGGFPGNTAPALFGLRNWFSGGAVPTPTPTPTPPAPTPTPTPPTPTPAPTPTPPASTTPPTPPAGTNTIIYMTGDVVIYQLVNGEWKAM